MQAIIHAADLQDRDGGVVLMGALSSEPSDGSTAADGWPKIGSA
jgi:hypothetical protein